MLITADHASAKFGGESILPLHYFRFLHKAGVEVFLLVHERVRAELDVILSPEEQGRVTYVREHWLAYRLQRLGRRLPSHIRGITFAPLRQLITQAIRRRKARDLVLEKSIDVVHEPTPVSPRQPSMMYGLGVPVVIGPMNGGMVFPPAFHHYRQSWELRLEAVVRAVASLMQYIIPGKLHAACLLVANDRTRKALPICLKHVQVKTLVENGVDLELWQVITSSDTTNRGNAIRLAFTGRLVDWKGVDLLLEAFARVHLVQSRLELHIFGDGPERTNLEVIVKNLHIESSVVFHGFKKQDEIASFLGLCDIFVLPSLHECGGAVVLEAMALSLPVIATNWGGPADYIDTECGILIEPHSRDQFVQDLASAIIKLAENPLLGQTLGRRGRQKVESLFSWQVKISDIQDIYRSVIHRNISCAVPRTHSPEVGYEPE